MLKIRLRRMGNRNRPFYRVVVSDSRRATNARALDELGYYDPVKGPDAFRIDAASLEEWVAKGAQPSATIKRLVRRRAKTAGAAA